MTSKKELEELVRELNKIIEEARNSDNKYERPLYDADYEDELVFCPCCGGIMEEIDDEDDVYELYCPDCGYYRRKIGNIEITRYVPK